MTAVMAQSEAQAEARQDAELERALRESAEDSTGGAGDEELPESVRGARILPTSNSRRAAEGIRSKLIPTEGRRCCGIHRFQTLLF